MEREKILASTPDDLFEKFSLLEINRIKRIFVSEIKVIRENLRKIIGEKYQDFIEATDKIDDMKTLTHNISEGIVRINEQYTSISGPNGWVCNDSRNVLEKKSKNPEFMAAVLIKLLIDITEQIWCAIDNDDYISATLLLQLSGHIKTVLEIDTSLQLKVSFPIVYQQWGVIMRFPVILTTRIEQNLLNTQLMVKGCNECLCSLLILENLTPESLLEKFLSIRSKALEHSFKMSHDIKQKQGVKANIIISLQIVFTTLQMVHTCFIENSLDKEDVLRNHLQNVEKYMKSVFSLVHLDHTYAHAVFYIPLIVKEFKVTLNNDSLQLVNLDIIRQKVSNWLVWVKEYVATEAVSLLAIVSSVKWLKSIKDSCQIFPENWIIIMEFLKLPPNFNLWYEFYQSSMINRVKDILSDNWNNTYTLLKQEIDSLILDANNTRPNAELNLHSFIWGNTESNTLSNKGYNRDKLKKDLSVKIEGLFPKSTSMCESMEKYISAVMQDLLNICDEPENENEKITALKHFQQHCGFHFVIRIVEYICNIVLSEGVSMLCCVLIAKFLSGVTTLCPSLKQCLLVADNKGSKWIEIKSMLQEKSESIWTKWVSLALPDIINTFKSELGLHSDSGLQIKILPKWNTFNVEEENEDGQLVQSVIKVPCSISFPLQHVLNQLNVLCGQVLPPKLVIIELISGAITEILSCYSECCEYSLLQVHYTQFMFDVMYLISLLVPVENKHILSECQDTISKLESKIDLFDLDAISQFLMNNVKLCVSRTQAVYGLIAMNKINTTSVAVNIASSDDPNILNICAQNIPWFPLLPITTSHTAL